MPKSIEMHLIYYEIPQQSPQQQWHTIGSPSSTKHQQLAIEIFDLLCSVSKVEVRGVENCVGIKFHLTHYEIPQQTPHQQWHTIGSPSSTKHQQLAIETFDLLCSASKVEVRGVENCVGIFLAFCYCDWVNHCWVVLQSAVVVKFAQRNLENVLVNQSNLNAVAVKEIIFQKQLFQKSKY